MKLKEKVESFEAGQKIKVGCVDGSSFFFCGDRETFLANIDEYNTQLLRRAHWKEQSTRRSLNKFMSVPPTLVQYVAQELEKEHPHPSLEAYQSSVKGWINGCVGRSHNVKEAEKYRKSYVTLSEREVVEEREAEQTVEENAKILIVTGNEVGLYWTMDEATKKPFAIALANDAE